MEYPEIVGSPLDTAVPNADGTWDIEKILKAEKVGREWHLTIKWKGWSRPTVETRAWLRNPDNCTDTSLLRDAEKLIDAARRGQRPDDGDEDEESDDDDEYDVEPDDGSNQIMVLSAESEDSLLIEYFMESFRTARTSM